MTYPMVYFRFKMQLIDYWIATIVVGSFGVHVATV